MLWWGRLGFTTHFLPFPPIQPHSKHLVPAPVPSGYKTPLTEEQDRVRGGCWQVQGPHGSLSPVLALRCSAAGEFFPEAAQVAYRMWELSAVKVEVSTPSPPAPPLCCLQLGTPGCSSLPWGTASPTPLL